jgi:5'(3')-deoxyribonucleotidase
VADLDGAIKNHIGVNELKYKEDGDADVDEATQAKIRAFLRKEGTFASLDVIEGAQDAIAALEKDNCYVFFCTSPLRDFHPCAKEKHEWVTKHFGKEHARRMILAKDKTFIQTHILIDDKKQAGFHLYPPWMYIIFDHPRNQALEGKRLKKWADWKDILTMWKDNFTFGSSEEGPFQF